MKPTKKEWEVCKNFALKLADANEENSRKLRKFFFSYMWRLLKKYPGNIDILVSIADVYVYNRSAVRILIKMYDLAVKNGDYKNMSLISESLVLRMLSDTRIDYEQTLFWTNTLANNLQNYSEPELKNTLTLSLEVLKEKRSQKRP